MPPKAKAATHLSVPQTLKEQKVTLAKGLSAAEVEARQSQYGRNELDQEEPTPLWKLVLEQFDDQLVQILLGAALLSTILAFMEESEDGGLALEAFVEPAVILTILILNAIVGVWQESSAESALEALKKMQSLHTPCLRDGEWNDTLPTEDLVPGDVVRSKPHCQLPIARCAQPPLPSAVLTPARRAQFLSATRSRRTCVCASCRRPPSARTRLR